MRQERIRDLRAKWTKWPDDPDLNSDEERDFAQAAVDFASLLDDEDGRRDVEEEHASGPKKWSNESTLGDIADELTVMKDAGITRGSVLYVVDRVWHEEAHAEAGRLRWP